MNNLKIGSFNVRGLKDPEKHLHTFRFLREQQFDIVFLQETHTTQEQEHLWYSQWSGRIAFSHGTANSKGAAVLFKCKPEMTFIEFKDKVPGRLHMAKIRIETDTLLLVNVYAPNENSPQFYTQMKEAIEQEIENTTGLIIGGNFNLVLDIEKDKIGKKVTNEKAQQVLIGIINHFDLYDTWRFHHAEERGFTWRRKKPKLIMVRLDYFLVSETLKDKIVSADNTNWIQIRS